MKQKFGSLRFYADVPGSDRGAIDLAEEMSRRICEVSGRPGRLCQNSRRLLATLAPGVQLPGKCPDRAVTAVAGEAEPMTGKMDIPPLGFSLDDMARWRADVLVGPVDVAAGWRDLADAVLHVAQRRRKYPEDGNEPTSVRRIWRDDTGLRLDWKQGAPVFDGLSEIASALSQRIDPTTGTMSQAPI